MQPLQTKTLIRKLERILNKLYRQNLSLIFNETCLNERLLPNYTYKYIYIDIDARGGARGVVVIVVGNGHGDTSSFHIALGKV